MLNLCKRTNQDKWIHELGRFDLIFVNQRLYLSCDVNVKTLFQVTATRECQLPVTFIKSTKRVNWLLSFEVLTSKINFAPAQTFHTHPYLVTRTFALLVARKHLNYPQTRALACAEHFSLWIFSSIHCIGLDLRSTLLPPRTLFASVS